MGHIVNIRIWEPINQASRAVRYEVPLAAALHTHRMGELAGVGAVMSSEMEIKHVEFETFLSDLDKGARLAKLVLERAGAPRGSELRFMRNDSNEVVRFGNWEGLAVYLDGISLPATVYDTCSTDGLAALFANALYCVDGEIRGSWAGPCETSLYMYGPDAETMFSFIRPILASYPLCQNARVVIRHGNPYLHPRTVRIPYHRFPGNVRQFFWGNVQGTV